MVLTAVMPYAAMPVMGMGSLLGYSFSLGHLLTFDTFETPPHTSQKNHESNPDPDVVYNTLATAPSSTLSPTLDPDPQP